jgi:hypothetical protein
VTRAVALVRHPLAIAGALLATVSAVAFVALAIAAMAGLFHNPYAGLVIAIAIPALLVLGLLLIPAGMWLERRRRARHGNEVRDWPVLDFRSASVRRIALAVTALTAVNAVIVLLAGYGSLHYMESPGFCGQACHTPMQPQFVAWGEGPHARVACAQCHVGEGARGFVQAKLAGVRQLGHVITNSYARPTPPGAEMPPGMMADGCRSCHRAERTIGDRLRVIRSYADDDASTETTTALQMHLGMGSPSGRAIHWHADPGTRVEYISTDETNETIPYVKVTGAGGQVREYRTADTTDEVVRTGTRRTMDCIDCHNTVGHPIAQTPEQAVDDAIAAGRIDRQLPHARREAVSLTKASYASNDEALSAIARELPRLYQSHGGSAHQPAVDLTVAAVQAVYRRSVFPTMKVSFGTYPTQLGHITATGCFRCHDDSHVDKSGAAISADCEYCHKQLDALPTATDVARLTP